MKTLKFGFLFFAIIAFLFSCQKTDDQDEISLGLGAKKAFINEGECGMAASTRLMAGQHIEVGVVEVVPDGTFIKVTFRITDENWILKETHLSVKADLASIPKNNPGNPQIGNFEYKMEHNPYVWEYTYTVPVDGIEYVFIAAHAVVLSKSGETCITLAELESRLPSDPVDVSFGIKLKDYYYDITLTNAGPFSKTYIGWCVDNNNRPVDYSKARLVSSYSTTYPLGDIVPNPDNLDLLNYLMNTYYPSEKFPVLQTAIWLLMNGTYPTDGHKGGINPSDAEYNRAVAIAEDAKKNGEGFVPGCDQWVVILVDSGNREAHQNSFFLVKRKVPVWDGSETAWGEGSPFTDSSWAMYFEYCLEN